LPRDIHTSSPQVLFMALYTGLLKRMAGKTTAEIDNSKVAMPPLSEERQREMASWRDIVATVTVIARVASSTLFSIHRRQPAMGSFLKTHNRMAAGTHGAVTTCATPLLRVGRLYVTETTLVISCLSSVFMVTAERLGVSDRR
jgi:hypothetical protein